MADQQLTPPQQEDASTETHAEPDTPRHGDAGHRDASSAAADHAAPAHDDHGHASERLGPVDRAAWGAGILGVLLGLVVVVAIALASGAIG